MEKKKTSKEIIKSKILKSNALISARYKQKYTLHGQKTILWILSQIDKNDIDNNDEYTLSVKEYSDALGIDPSYIYQEAQNIAEKLMSKILSIKEENGNWIVCAWLSGMRYENGTLYVSIYPPLKPHLLALKSNFTTYQLKYSLELSSTYAIRIYELLSQYRTIGNRIIDVGELREMLGIQPGELKQFVDLRNGVLNIAQREINAKTDIAFDWKPIKTSRTITRIKFLITQKARLLDEDKKDMLTINDELKASLLKIGFNEKELAKLITDFGENKIGEKYEYLSFQKKIKLPKQWLIKALVDDYNVADMNIEKVSTKQKEQHKLLKEQEIKINDYLGALNSPLAEYDDTFKEEQEKLLTEARLKYKEMKQAIEG